MVECEWTPVSHCVQAGDDFLAIPAASAPSERVWSRASQVLSIRRANLSPDVATRIMFARENLLFIYKYYEELTGKSIAQAHLPGCEEEEGDVEQDDNMLLF